MSQALVGKSALFTALLGVTVAVGWNMDFDIADDGVRAWLMLAIVLASVSAYFLRFCSPVLGYLSAVVAVFSIGGVIGAMADALFGEGLSVFLSVVYFGLVFGVLIASRFLVERRSTGVSWREAIVLANCFFARPIDSLRECLRDTAG